MTQDAKLVAEVIRRWLNDNGRWNSPKFLGGESYGTTRSAAVANQLMNVTYNDVALNGIILISTVLDFAAGADTAGNELSPITNLPSMAATALYHGKATAPSVEGFVEEARQWAIGPYATALLKGQKLQERGTRRDPPRTVAFHRPFGNLSRERRPARHAEPFLQGTAARPRADRRPARQPLYRQGL